MKEDFMLRWLGGLLDSDGCFCILVQQRKSGKVSFSPSAIITTKYKHLVEHVSSLLHSFGINHHIKKNGTCFNITISRLKALCCFYELMHSFVISKYNEFTLVYKFCSSRLTHKSKRSTYTDNEIRLAGDLKKLNRDHYGRCEEYGILYESVGEESLRKLSLWWLAGYVDGDGEVNIHKINRPRGGFQLRSTITIVTGSPLSKNLISCILDRYNIDYYLHKQLPGVKHKPNCRYKKFSFSIRKLDEVLDLCKLMKNKLVLKNNRCFTLSAFCENRLERRFEKYNDLEMQFYYEIKDPPTTIRKTTFVDDIV